MVTNPTPTEASERIAVTPSSTLQDMPVSEVLSGIFSFANNKCDKHYVKEQTMNINSAIYFATSQH